MKLFDEKDRKTNRLPWKNENKFEYLNKSSRGDCKKIRNLLEDWFSNIKISDFKKDLKSRFRGNNREHIAAFFEIYLYNLFSELGYKITVHPEIGGHNPDFLIKNDFREFIVEATTVTHSEGRLGEIKRVNEVVDYLNKNLTPIPFQIYLNYQTPPSSSQPKQKMYTKVKKKVNSLLKKKKDYDELKIKTKTDWSVEFDFYRCSNPLNRPVIKFPPAKTSRLGKKIKNSISEKASKYEDPELPFILALNVWSESPIEDFDINEGLFGNLKIHVKFNKKEGVVGSRGYRDRKGKLMGPWKPENKRLSAFLIFNNINPWSIGQVEPELWHNPWAKNEIKNSIFPFSCMDFMVYELGNEIFLNPKKIGKRKSQIEILNLKIFPLD